ncbi:MAG: precorrin-6y C5,15-methyltransferase (decarboxylating) subunit CbiE [Deltaproteobacteria bacterium]|nr:precorrin-6y C5,15-methyltransferase (decarboxylating) subunit CbiE [Deltaproteobacteria bacterium]
MNELKPKIFILGLGFTPLSEKAQKILFFAKKIVTFPKFMHVLEKCDTIKDRIVVLESADKVKEYLRKCINSHIIPVAVLSSGDPLFHGVGKLIVEEFGRENVDIIPDVSSFQIAFSKIKESWEDAYIMTVHGSPKLGRNRYRVDDVPYFLNLYGKICIFTDKINNPKLIANTLFDYFGADENLRMFVAERIGYEDERILEGNPYSFTEMDFKEPNLVVLIWDKFRPQKRMGFSVSEIEHKEGQITKDEIRAVILHKLCPERRCVIWDIGAGSGSISLELSLLFPEVEVFAIERDEMMLSLLERNRKKFKARYKIVPGEAPEVLSGLPIPDRVFVGGSGGKLKEILNYLIKHDIGHIVFALTVFDNLSTVLNYIPGDKYRTEISQILSFSSRELASSWYFVPNNPVYIVLARHR